MHHAHLDPFNVDGFPGLEIHGRPGFDVRFLHMILVDGLDDSVIQRHAEIPKRGMSAHGFHKRVGS